MSFLHSEDVETKKAGNHVEDSMDTDEFVEGHDNDNGGDDLSNDSDSDEDSDDDQMNKEKEIQISALSKKVTYI